MNFKDIFVRVITLDAGFYDQVRQEEALAAWGHRVVLAAALGSGLGVLSQAGLLGLLVGALAMAGSWYVWASLIYVIATKFFPESEKTAIGFGAYLNEIGFAAAPGILRVLGIIPILMLLVFPLTNLWMGACLVVATRKIFDHAKLGKAIAIVLAAWFLQSVVLIALLSLLGMPFAA